MTAIRNWRKFKTERERKEGGCVSEGWEAEAEAAGKELCSDCQYK